MTNVRLFNPDTALQQAAKMASHGQRTDAEQIYKALLQSHPKQYSVLHDLAKFLMKDDRFEEAVPILCEAVDQKKTIIDNLMLAWALLHLDRNEEALRCIQVAISIDSNSADAYAIKSLILAYSGRYEEAIVSQNYAIELCPARPYHYHMLGYISRWKPSDPRLKIMEDLDKPQLDQNEKIFIKFAIGKAYADLGDIEHSFNYLLEANALKRKQIAYDEQTHMKFLSEIRNKFDLQWINARYIPKDLIRPIFIVGMPRSGTTLVEQILASHPEVQALGECREFARSLSQNTKSSPPNLFHSKWTEPELQEVGASYIASIENRIGGRVFFTDKQPTNWRFLGLIHACLPNARIIHIDRDPIDLCLSIFSLIFPDNSCLYSYNLGELGRYYRSHKETMDHWQSILPSGVLLNVKYEDLINDFENQVHRILGHCNLPWNESCLDFYKTERQVRTASHSQVRQPIYRSSINKPRPPYDLLKPLLEALGD